MYLEISLVVYWLRLCTFTAKGAGLIPGWGTKIPQVTQDGQKKKKKHAFIFGSSILFHWYMSILVLHLKNLMKGILKEQDLQLLGVL